LNTKLPIDKLLDIEAGQYRVAVAAFKRVKQIAGNDRLRGLLKDSKRLPVVALANVLNESVRIIELTEEQIRKIKSSDDEE
jgi:DNA-directed RNA polymerase subunit K/omega